MTEVTFEGDAVIATDPECLPSRRVFTLAEAFAGSGRLLFVRDPDKLTALLRTLAARLGDLPGRDGARQRYWRGWAPVPARTFTWTWKDRRASLAVDGAIARVPERPGELVPWQPLDDLFVHGPTQPGIPRDVRAALIAHLGGDPADAFPGLDHAAIARRDWTWNEQADGDEGAALDGAALIVGYRFGHDQGWSEHAVERVITRAPEIYLSAPATACDDLYAALATAVAA